MNPTVGDLKGNAGAIAERIAEAARLGADVVTFPELALCGYPPEDLLMKPSFLRDSRIALEEVVATTRGTVAIVGFPDLSGNSLYNAAAVIHDGRIAGVYHKVELPNYGVFDEKRYFARGDGSLVMEIRGIRISVTICEDLWVKDSPVERAVRDNGAALTVNIAASPFHAGKIALRRSVLSEFAKRTGACLSYNNIVGGQDELVFDGGVMVTDREGRLIASGQRFAEGLIITDFDAVELASRSGRSASHGKLVVVNCRGTACHAPAGGNCANGSKSCDAAVEPEFGRIEEIFEALKLGLRDYVRKNGFKKVVLGISGGVDSAITAAIAADALGKENVVGVRIPSRYTSEGTFKDAEILARNLGIQCITISLEKIFTLYMEELAGAFGPGAPGIEAENLQARIRGNILMGLSNRFGWLVLTTGNKSEIACGYCTLYGDMAGGYSVIKDVFKTVVYEISDFYNMRAGYDAIPQSIIDRPPTAELRPNQKDEDSLPPYPLLDPILRAYVEEDMAAEEIAARGFDIAVVREVVRMVDRNEYKRRQAPPGVKITPKAFGKDRRIPMTNRYATGMFDKSRPVS